MAKLLKSSKTIEFYIGDFLEHCQLKELSRKTINSYESTLGLLVKFLEEEYQINALKDIEEKHIEEYILFTKDRGKYSFVSDDKTIKYNNPQARTDFGKKVSATTVNNYIRNIKVFFNYCKDKKFIKDKPTDQVKFLKNNRKPKEDITDLEFKSIVKAINTTLYSEYRDYVIIQLIFDTGMRITETLNIEIASVDIEKRFILLDAEITKSRKERYVFFSNTMASILIKWLAFKDRYNNDEYMFSTKGGSIISASNFERNFRNYKAKAGINKAITPHCLRNNFAKRFLLSGGDIFMLSKILGHSSVVVTEKAYLDVTMTDIRKSYQRFSPLENIK